MTLPPTLRWDGESLELLDQRALPHAVRHVRPDGIESVHHAIRTLTVRGAPAIGIAAAYGLVVAMRPHADLDGQAFLDRLDAFCDTLATARPTAVNLSWAIRRMQQAARLEPAWAALRAAAEALHASDRETCHAIGRHAARLIEPGATILTYCNAGALAVSEFGTATAPMYAAHGAGVPFSVIACETRPLWQGARLTAWELSQAGIEVTLICDNMAASVMSTGDVTMVMVGTDRVTANGDVVNKIGTLNLAVLCRHFGLPFYVACPSSTYDPLTATGAEVTIEQRPAAEVLADHAARVPARNPAFDVTPAALVTAYLTDRGVITDTREIARLGAG